MFTQYRRGEPVPEWIARVKGSDVPLLFSCDVMVEHPAQVEKLAGNAIIMPLKEPQSAGDPMIMTVATVGVLEVDCRGNMFAPEDPWMPSDEEIRPLYVSVKPVNQKPRPEPPVEPGPPVEVQPGDKRP